MPYPAAIILAAGEASRFDSPKQMLVWKGQTLVARAVQAATDAGCEKVVVVTGAHQEAITNTLRSFADFPTVSLSQNPNWEDGMLTSIAHGLRTLLELASDVEAVLVLTVDQPLIDAPFLRKLIDTQKGFDAAALAYPSGPGVPACFGASLFDQLLNLTTNGGGAKGILRNPVTKTALVNDPEKRQDIDTLADWHDFNRTNH